VIESELIWTTDPLVAAKRCLAFFVRCKLLDPNELVGERGFEPPTPWSRTKMRLRSKCFIDTQTAAQMAG
jgi:hypothetical protein